MVRETIARVTQSDLSQGLWCATGQDSNVWVDASSLATGMLLEPDDVVFEDACWLRPANDAQHINLAELDTALKGTGVTMEIQSHALKNKIGKRVLLTGGHAHRKDQSTHEDHQRNVAPLTIRNDKVAGRRVWTVHRRCSDPVDPEFGGSYDPGTAKVA